MADTTEASKKDNFDELQFLREIALTLAFSDDSQVLLNNLKTTFAKYFRIENFQIFIKDESSNILRDFVKNWITVEKNRQQEFVENIFQRLKNVCDKGFILNNKLIKYSDKTEQMFLNNLKDKQNLLYFPVFNEKTAFGVIEINFNEIEKNTASQHFLTVLRIAAAQINTTIVNKILNQKLCVQIKFQKVMKSIAKLIENQFELNYILPIIGELIDGFVTEHLIYIFIKDKNNKFKLFWPLDCQDSNILSLLPKINDKKNCVISKDGKAGLFALKKEDKITGVIAAGSNIDKLSKADIDYLQQLTLQASVTTQRANSYAQVLKYATLDALTGLNNRRQFEVRLKQETANAIRNKKPLCCIMLDIDYFKHVNDTWGHSAGDCVLKNVAKIISHELREYDIASRYGGEEFCILLPDTKIKEAAFVAQRLRKAVEKAEINISDEGLAGEVLNVTISIGVSEFDDTFDSANKLHQYADAALYEAKRRGRNRVVVYDESLS